MMLNQFNRREFFARTAISGLSAALTTTATAGEKKKKKQRPEQKTKLSTPNAQKIGWRIACQLYTFRDRSFYEALVSGEIARDPFRGAEALRRAQLDQVKDEQRLGIRRPLIWANFIFSGVL